MSAELSSRTFYAFAHVFRAKLHLPIESGGAFYAFCTAALPLGPGSPSSVTGQPAARWGYVKLVKAAERGRRAICEDAWPPRMWVFGTVLSVRATAEKSQFFSAEMRTVFVRGESSSSRLRRAASRKDLPTVGWVLGALLEDALTLRAASTMSTAFFGARRASEVASLNASEVCVDSPTGIADIKVSCQKNG